MPDTDLMTLEDWNSDAEESLSRIEEGSKFAGQVPGIDLETLTGELQGYFNMGGFDLLSFKQSGRLFAKTYSEYKEGLQKILEKFRANIKDGLSLSSAKRIALDDFRDVCFKSYSSAYRAGMLRVGNPADEIGAGGRKIAGAAAGVESGFFGGRLADAINPEMDSIIVGGYSDSLKSQYFNGMVAGADNNQKFIWKLGSVERHCADCMDIAAASPFTKLDLPTVPRAGDTECLWNCNCTLELLGGIAAQVGAGLRPGEQNLSVSVTSLAGAKVPLSTVRLFDDLYNEVNRARVAFEFAVDAAEKKAIIARKTVIAQNIIDLADSLSVRVVPTWSLGDIKAITAALRTKGYTFIKSLDQIYNGAKIWLLQGTGVKTAVITSITRTGIMMNIGGQSVTYKSIENFIGFAKG